MEIGNGQCGRNVDGDEYDDDDDDDDDDAQDHHADDDDRDGRRHRRRVVVLGLRAIVVQRWHYNSHYG
jgi:hypothetical protein